ncbi:MAG: hypothetical protein M3P04_12970 [Actinomycetota bacterium]|nr:hypothetical protein [Actinomycetota bacterium]
MDLGRARAPFRDRLYESHYLTATDPAGGRALWLRHTALHGKPSVWVTWFDPEPHAERVELDEPLSTSDWPRCSLGGLTPTTARGTLGRHRWDLRWEPHATPLPYLPSTWLYDRAFPRSNGVAIVPHATVHGRYDGTTLDGWHGVVGHNWGRDHAEQWCWLHAVLPTGWVDLVLVRIRVGRALTPWIAGGGVSEGGRVRRTRPGRVELVVDGDRTFARVPLRGGRVSVDAHSGHVATWDYASPAGPGRTVRNCSVADATVTVDGQGEWQLKGTVAVEHGRP